MEKKEKNLIGVIGDLHFKEALAYSDYISGGRTSEKKNTLDFIVNSFSDCDHIVILGDCFDNRNPSAETVKEFVTFIESFGKKEIYIISGNHSKKGSGSTALDFLKEIKDKDNWHIYTKVGRAKVGLYDVDFLPYMLNSELGVTDRDSAVEKIMKDLKGGDLLFAHHSISGTTFNGIKTDTLSEIVLPKVKLEKKYGLVVAGHIHESQQTGRVLVTGNIFTSQIGDIEKFIWKIKSDLGIEKIKIPQRSIYKLDNPTLEQITALPKDSIAKIVVTDKKIDLDELKVVAAGLDAFLLVEDYPSARTKTHIQEGAFDFSIEALIKLYAKAKGVDEEKLLKGLALIKN